MGDQDSTEPDLPESDVGRIVGHFHDLLRDRLDSLDTAVLNAHFLLEEQLDELLGELALQPNRLNLKVPFDVKVKALRAFAPIGDDPRWDMVETINKLRNGLAHLHGRDDKEKALNKLREIWKREIEKDQPFVEQDWLDYNVTLGVTVTAIGFLSAVRTEIRKANLGHSAQLR